MRLLIFAFFSVLLVSCRPPAPETIPLPTEICVKTAHHNVPIPDAVVYVKFNADSFPGYDQSPEYYDTSFITGKDARGCLVSVPEGKHWLVAFGYDSLSSPGNVFGSLPIYISLDGHTKIDTSLYVSEDH